VQSKSGDHDLKTLVDFLNKIGGNGNLSQMPQKFESITKEMEINSNLVDDTISLLNKLTQQNLVSLKNKVDLLSQILESHIVYTRYVTPLSNY